MVDSCETVCDQYCIIAEGLYSCDYHTACLWPVIDGDQIAGIVVAGVFLAHSYPEVDWL